MSRVLIPGWTGYLMVDAGDAADYDLPQFIDLVGGVPARGQEFQYNRFLSLLEQGEDINFCFRSPGSF